MKETRVFITKDKKNIGIYVREEEAEAERAKVRKLMRRLDLIECEKQRKMDALKVCPDCHMKCTESGFCKVCGRDCRDVPVKGPAVKIITNKDADWGIIKVTI